MLTGSFVEIMQEELFTDGDDVHYDSPLELPVLLSALSISIVKLKYYFKHNYTW